MTELEYNYLVHHGILGQRWGRRNGPPYPLDASDHSAVEKKHLSKSLSGKRHEEMYNRKSKSNSNNSEKKDFHLTDQQKKYIKIGATVAATALVAYGGYKISTNPKLRRLVGKGLDFVTKTPSIEDMIANSGPEIVRKTKLPGDAGSVINPNKFTNNCKEVAEANIKRWLGVDTNAIAGAKTVSGNLHDFIDAKGYNIDGIKWINDRGGIMPDPSGDSSERVKKQILKHYKDGDCGFVGVTWNKKYLAPNTKETGHVFNWRIVNGNAIFPDDQPDPPLKNAIKHFQYLDLDTEIEIVQIMKEAFAK